ncbi:MAG TPA: class F sortase [Acidimicrobiales bacterium]|nr:class F sortase [Acidimicrobiales bacterium]
MPTVDGRRRAQTPPAARAIPRPLPATGPILGVPAIGSGAAVPGNILGFRPSWRGPGRLLVTLLLVAGFGGGAVLTDRPDGNRAPPPAAAPDPYRATVPVEQDAAAPSPDPPPVVPAAAVPVAAASATEAPPATVAPPAGAHAATTPSAPRGPEPLRSPVTPPDARRWIASSAPLPASPPTRVEIAAVGVTPKIGPLGLNRDGTLEVPADFSRAGWYTGRPSPGEAGPAVVVAHRASRRGPGAFWKLPAIQPGQEVVVIRADGRRLRFTVDRVEQHRKDAFPTDAVYGPTSETALRLITCGGPFEPALGDRYRDNVIVFARMTGWAA